MSLRDDALQMHKENQGKLQVTPNVKVTNKKELSLAYSPGVAEPCKEIHEDPRTVYDYTIKRNTVAVVTDGTAVLGLGNIGAAASIPVMEGKAVLFKSFAGINGVPIALDTTDTEEIIQTVKL
ncbi:NADP-dependent malic enzyme, partial [Staphylococcus hominis]